MRVLASRPEPAILVGHSMGGVVVTQAASDCPEHVASLVFVAAFMPANGQSLLDLTHLPEGEGDLIQANIVIEGSPPVAVLSAEATAAAVYNDCTSEQTAWARGQTPSAGGRAVCDPGRPSTRTRWPRFPARTCSRLATAPSCPRSNTG